MRYHLFIFLLLCSSAWADWGPSSCQDTIVISSLPDTLTESDTCYCLSGNLDAGAGSGIFIPEHTKNVSLFFGGDTIWFGDTTGDNTYGLYIYGTYNQVDSIYIGGPGAIISNAQVTGSDTSWGSRCIKTYAFCSFVHIDTLNLSANGGNAQCIFLFGDYGVKVSRCRMANHSRWYVDRCGYNSAVVQMHGFEGAIPGVDDFYHACFLNNVIDSGHAQGFRLKGVVKAIGNEIHLSACNFRYPTSDNYCANSSNAYGFILRGVKNLAVGDTLHVSEFRDNTVYVYDEYFGADGMFEVECTFGLPDTPIVFINNKGYIRRGWDPHYGGGLAARGIAKIRYSSGLCGGYAPTRYLHFKHDSCWVYSRKSLSLADTASEWSSYGRWATGFYIIATPDDTLNVIESCYVRSIALLDTTDGDYNIGKQGASGIQLLGEGYVDKWAIRDNVFECNHSCIRLGYGDDGARYWDAFYDNNFVLIDTGADREYLSIYCDRYNTDDNDFLDNMVTPDTVWDKMYWYGSTPQNARIRRTLDLYVKGNNNLPVPGCSVFVWNDYLDSTIRSQAVSAGVTGDDGYFHPVVSIYYGTVGAGDSLNTDYCDFRFKAFYHSDPDSVSMTYCVKPHQYTDTLTLANTGGAAASERFIIGSGGHGGTATRFIIGNDP